MIYLNRIILVSVIFFFSLSSVYSSEKIAFFDLDYVISKSKAGTEITKKLEKINENNIKILNDDQKKLKKELEEINKVKNVIEKKELEKRVKNHNNNINNINKKKKELSNKLIELRKKEIVELVNKINPILENYMNENSIDIILSKQGVYISKSNYDITKTILEIVNKEIN